ncbi:MAG: hypothetical protein P0S95_03595 [Rhabdochlamydiaceae bacterium]|nr:hypothetical protein [Candidatus Amphrikana amoebophyrae]
MRLIIFSFLALCISFTSFIFGEINLPQGLTIEHEVESNEIVKGSFPITNKGEKQLRVKISLADYSFSCDGSNYFDPPGSKPRSNANWLNLSNEFFVEIPPKENINIDYELRVPKDKNLEGSYWSMLLIEPQKELSKEPEDDNTLSINTVIRYGIQMVTNVKNSGEESIEILSNRTDKTNYIVDVKNNGSLFLRPKMVIELFSQNGEQVAKVEGGQFRIFPDTSVRYSAPLEALPKGHYKSLVLFDYGEDSMFGFEDDIIID